jgi:hypothetical protein
VLGAGCYSDSPLDPSPQFLDADLLGSWNCVTSDPQPPAGVVVTLRAAPARDREYNLTVEASGEQAKSYRAFVSEVLASRFLNIHPAEDTSKGWAFIRYSFPRSDLGVLYVERVSEAPFSKRESSASPEAARATLEAAFRLNPPLRELGVCIRRVPKVE